MKYRIKDPDVVKAFKILGWSYEFDETEVKRFGFYWHGDCRDRIYLSLNEELEVEPVPKVVDGWHPFPADKPDTVGRYLVAYDCDGEREVAMMSWTGENFYPADDDAVAWRELPKYW